jgi:hypothetical protein
LDNDCKHGSASPEGAGTAHVLGRRVVPQRGSTNRRFLRLGLGNYFQYQSSPLSVGSENALNCFFPMPFQKHARITVTNEGEQKVDAFYFNIDYRIYSHVLPQDTLYFHAQYRQATPAHGWTNKWQFNGERLVEDKKNLDGKDNYVWMEASGRGHFVGVTMSVLQNQDG